MPTVDEVLGVVPGWVFRDDVSKFALNDELMRFDAQGRGVCGLTISPAAGEALPGAGSILVEQTNDPATGVWFVCPTWNPATSSPSLSTSNISVTAAAARCFLPVMKFVRVRVAVALTTRPASAFLRVAMASESMPIPAVLTASDQGVVGPAAEDAAASGNPVLVAGVVRTANLASLVAGDAARHTLTTSAQLLVKEGHLPELDWSYAAAAGGIINTSDVAAKAAAGAGLRNYVYSLSVKNANAVAGEFVIKDGASTVLWRGHLSANMLDTDVIRFSPPLRGTANTAINIACLTTAQQVYANLQGGVGI